MGRGLAYLATLGHDWKGITHLTLEPITRVLKSLGSPQDRIKTIHIAGTNGKGSVSAATAAILAASGARVGLTISPHLSAVNERIVVDGLPISDEQLDYYCLEVAKACEKLSIKLSFFETLMAVAYLCFYDLSLDWAVVEVGLGGRLDASNVIRCPEACCVVTIDYDHEHILGDTLAKIAAEKAGIAKRGSKMVVGSMAPEPRKVILDKCNELQIPAFCIERDFSVTRVNPDKFEYEMLFCEDNGESFPFVPALIGEHQVHNMALAIKLARLVGIEPMACSRGVAEVFWPARLELIERADQTFLFDCAHNPAGMRELVDFIKKNSLSGLRCCFGALTTKNWKEMLDMLMPHVREWYLMRPESERALDPHDIVQYLSSNGISAKVLEEGYESAAHFFSKPAADTRYTLFAGSMYLIGKIRPYFVPTTRPIWPVLTKETLVENPTR